jgi:hypothetical protein
MRPPCLPHVTMSGISARRPLPRQGLKQAASSGVGPLAFWSASGVPLHSQGVPWSGEAFMAIGHWWTGASSRADD